MNSYLEPKHVLGELATAYEAERLVPFIGSGMSRDGGPDRDACTDWLTMVTRLRVAVGHASEAESQPGTSNPSLVVREADQAMLILRGYPIEQRIQVMRNALYNTHAAGIPVNTEALAKIRWPLVITTNYDDIFLRTLLHRTRVLGRNVRDCCEVVASLSAVTDPILWAIQGFVGSEHTLMDEDDLHRLASEIVLSHKQYQEATTGAPHFRRAFSEVYRHKTILFLGSGILEDYLINLFSETLTQCGAPVHGHYALLHKKELEGKGRVNAHFLEDRLHIRPVYFDDFSDIGRALSDLRTRVARNNPISSPRAISHVEPLALTYQVVDHEGGRNDGPVLEVRRTPLSPDEGGTHVVSVGRTWRDRRETIWAGGMAESVVGRELENDDFKRVPGCHHTYTIRDASNIYGLAARPTSTANNTSLDPRDLGVIPVAVEEVLTYLTQLPQTADLKVHLGLISAGPDAPWHPLFALAQMLVGIRRFCRTPRTHGLHIVIHVVDPRVWYPVASGRFPMARILASDTLSVRVSIMSPDSHADLFVWNGPISAQVEDVMKHFGLSPETWDATIVPHPSDKHTGPVPPNTPVAPLAEIKFSYRSRPAAGATPS